MQEAFMAFYIFFNFFMMKIKLKFLVPVLALFLTVGGIVLAANAEKCPVCEGKITFLYPYCGLDITKKHEHYSGTVKTENGETVYVKGVLVKCPTCGYTVSVDI